MIHKLALIQVGDNFVVSDDGQISRLLGLNKNGHASPWHLVATNDQELAKRIPEMNGLIEAAQAITPLVASGAQIFSGNGQITTTTNGMTPGRIALHPPGNETAGGKKSVKTLGLKYQQVWRLEKAGVKTIGDLSKLTEAKLLAKKGIGQSMVNSVRLALKKRGFSLR